MYVITCMRLDLAHVVGVVNWLLFNRGKKHWSTVK
jgi:hypothetical protein